MSNKLILILLSLILILGVALGCGQSAERAWQEGYDQGYKDGLNQVENDPAKWYVASPEEAAAIAAAELKEMEGSRWVYITRSGTKYHLEDCRHVSHTEPEMVRLDEAIDRGYRPCSVCKP